MGWTAAGPGGACLLDVLFSGWSVVQRSLLSDCLFVCGAGFGQQSAFFFGLSSLPQRHRVEGKAYGGALQEQDLAKSPQRVVNDWGTHSTIRGCPITEVVQSTTYVVIPYSEEETTKETRKRGNDTNETNETNEGRQRTQYETSEDPRGANMREKDTTPPVVHVHYSNSY